MQGFSNLEELRITEGMRDSLLSGMKWLNFLTIMCCIGMGFVVLMGVGFLFGGTFVASLDSNTPTGLFPVMGIVYLIIAGVYVYPIMKCFNLISNTRKAMSGMQENLEMAADDFAAIMRFVGIFTIIALGLYALLIIVAIAGVGIIAFMR